MSTVGVARPYDLLGASPAVADAVAQLARAAGDDRGVLITAEPGLDAEAVARAIHEPERAARPALRGAGLRRRVGVGARETADRWTAAGQGGGPRKHFPVECAVSRRGRHAVPRRRQRDGGAAAAPPGAAAARRRGPRGAARRADDAGRARDRRRRGSARWRAARGAAAAAAAHGRGAGPAAAPGRRAGHCRGHAGGPPRPARFHARGADGSRRPAVAAEHRRAGRPHRRG